MSAPLRILRIVTRLNIGGPSIHVGVLVRGLDAVRFDTRLVAGSAGTAEGDMSSEVLAHPEQVIRLPRLRRALHPLNDLVVWWQLWRMIRRWRPHIVHTHMAKAGALGRSAAWVAGWGRRAHRPRIIHTFHGHVLDGYFSPRWTRIFTAIERWLARRTDWVIAVSPAVRDDLVARGITAPERIRVIPLGLPLEAFLAVDGPIGRWRDAHAPATPLLVWAGRLAPIKDVDLFIDALAVLRRRQPGLAFRAVIAGDGELRAHTEQLIATRGLADRVICAGWVPDMAALFADADVVCLTSRNEGTPVAVIQALAAARPVVATAVGGVPDVLSDTPSTAGAIPAGGFRRATGGLLVRAGDAESCAAAIAACLEQPSLRRQLGDAGRVAVRERYRDTRLTRDITDLYMASLRGTAASLAVSDAVVPCAS